MIDLQFFDKQKLLRTAIAQSVGTNNSVSAVAYEMCTAALQDFPASLKSKVYDVKPKD